MDDELNAVRIFFKLKKNDNLSIENVFKKYDEIMNSNMYDEAEKQKLKVYQKLLGIYLFMPNKSRIFAI